jgi:hypothetical protein
MLPYITFQSAKWCFDEYGCSEPYEICSRYFDLSIQNVKKPFLISNPVRRAKVGRLKKVKDRLKDFYSGISKFANKLAEAHGNRTHLRKIISM